MPQLKDAGLWAERYGTGRFEGRPALFLDRDGVVVEEVDFLRRPEDVRLIEEAAAAIAEANAAGVAVAIVTNQSGIARGYYDWAAFEAVQGRIAEHLAARSAHLDLVLACGYHRDGIGELARDHHWRKPETGMLLEAKDRLGLDLSRSFIIGDRLTDLAAGKAAGLPGGALVATGYGAKQAVTHAEQLRAWQADFDVSTGVPIDLAVTRWLGTISPKT